MAETRRKPATPALGEQGRALWVGIIGRYALEDHELALLLQAARTADTLSDLQDELDGSSLLIEGPQGMRVHPALVERRQQQMTLARLLVALRIPEDGAAAGGAPRGQRRGVRGVYGIKGGRA